MAHVEEEERGGDQWRGDKEGQEGRGDEGKGSSR